MEKKVMLPIILLAILTTLVPSCKKYDKHVALGSVRSIQSGLLERYKDNKWSSLGPGARLFAGDRIRTNDFGYAVISLEKVGRFVIGNNTEYVLGADAKKFVSSLRRGSVWYSSLLAKGSIMEISTPTAVCGARGTAFAVIADDSMTDVCTCEGIVDVAVRSGPAFAVREGKFSVVKKNQASGVLQDGYQLLDQVRQGNVRWYGICLSCHKDKKHALDISAQ